MNKNDCQWPGDDLLMRKYHDEEWGVPLHDDGKLFEYMILDAFQAGLSWRTVLYKRENFRKAFAGFDAEKIARFSDARIEKLMQDAGIIRNRLKIQATIQNARAFLNIREAFGSFDQYIWQFTDHRTLDTQRNPGEAPLATSAQSDAMSKALKKQGFRFVGSTICYAFMQASGMVNDHLVTCSRH